MMKKNKNMKKILLTLFIVSGIFLSVYLVNKNAPINSYGGITGISLYPDPKFTPGKAETLSLADLTKSYNGQTYSQAHRDVNSKEKEEVCAEYTENCKGKVEIDHFYPLCAGGSNDISNLWAEPEHLYIINKLGQNMPADEDWGFHTKDKLEAYICREIKTGSLDPKVAFQKMTTDWVAFYKEVFSGTPKAGSINGETDTDGDITN